MLNIKQGAKQARNVKLTANLDQGGVYTGDGKQYLKSVIIQDQSCPCYQ